ncbi:MAG: ligase 1 [Thermoproteota archaeon]|nr:ligase 1 [Thermoproteota archaeon]
MDYSLIADTYERIESTTKRLEMTNYLVELIKQTPKELIGKVAYLTQGVLYPDFMGIEVGVAERLAIDAISKASGIKKDEVDRVWKFLGDLGLTAEKLLTESIQKRSYIDDFLSQKSLKVEKVYSIFDRMAKTSGKGSIELKVKLFSSLITEASPRDAKYIIRTATGNLRLGIGDMTFLDALAIAYGGGKDARDIVEKAYNMSSDLGLVSETIAREGLQSLKKFGITLGRPIRPMLCERLTSAKEILEKLGGEGSAEYKYDGLRIQAHISPAEISLFSRRLEKITSQFPDVVEALKNAVRVREAVVEGECVATDIYTGELLPFQVVTQRRGRKYEIKEKVEEIPVVLVLFDILFADGMTLIDLPYTERRKRLEQIVLESERIRLTHPLVTNKPEDLDRYMDEAIADGCEGLVIKSIAANSVYQAGARDFLWIKYKRDYKSELADTLDLVAVGAFAGRGRRAGTYGALLMASYDEEADVFKTVCKLGTGFDDETLARLPKIFEPYLIDHPHPRVDSKIKADYWFVPAKVQEILGAELTLSPSHTCGLGIIKKDAGLAIRFPRFTGKWRGDKAPEDATTVKEMVELYQSQLKKIN